MNLNELLEKAGKAPLTFRETEFLASVREEEALKEIFAAARKKREEFFGNKIFLYGFVYFSTFCRNDCSFCFYRNSNDIPVRYRKTEDEIIRTAVSLRDSGVHLIDLTMGEDPWYLDHLERLTGLVKKVKQKTGLPVMISPGVVPDDAVALLKDAGADWYALYQETNNEELFKGLRLNQSYEARMHAKQTARRQGMLVEEGMLSGAGDSPADSAGFLYQMQTRRPDQGRTMTFVPQAGTPLADRTQNSETQELLNIALMRILFPDILIPASLDVDGLRGLKNRLDAGANVVTSIIPPGKGFMGVANSEFNIDDGCRTVQGIQDTLKGCGLCNASAAEYKKWVAERKKRTAYEK